jgi:hypothetical protein
MMFSCGRVAAWSRVWKQNVWRETMKRPKLEDMTQVEEARFRLLQARRAALRVLDKLSAVQIGALSPSSREDYERIRAMAETTVAITEPDWVATAQQEQLKQVANHLIDPATANWGTAHAARMAMRTVAVGIDEGRQVVSGAISSTSRTIERLNWESPIRMNAFAKVRPSDVARKSVT